MAEKTIAQLPDNPGLTGSALFEVQQGGASYKATVDEWNALLTADVDDAVEAAQAHETAAFQSAQAAATSENAAAASASDAAASAASAAFQAGQAAATFASATTATTANTVVRRTATGAGNFAGTSQFVSATFTGTAVFQSGGLQATFSGSGFTFNNGTGDTVTVNTSTGDVSFASGAFTVDPLGNAYSAGVVRVGVASSDTAGGVVLAHGTNAPTLPANHTLLWSIAGQNGFGVKVDANNAARFLFNNTASRDYTFPDITGTVTLVDATQTLANKTLTTPVLTAPVVKSTDITGYTIFNTADETTNFERGRIFFSSNVLNIASEKGGSGTSRDLRLIAGGNQYLDIRPSGGSSGSFRFVGSSTGTANAINLWLSNWISTATSGINTGVVWTGTYNQTSGTAANTDLLFNRTETAVGSGAQNLFDFQVGGSSRGRLTNRGVFLPSGALVLPSYTVATLPNTAANGMVQGAVVYVTDALSPTWLGTLTGGGSVRCLAVYNGTNWVAN